MATRRWGRRRLAARSGSSSVIVFGRLRRGRETSLVGWCQGPDRPSGRAATPRAGQAGPPEAAQPVYFMKEGRRSSKALEQKRSNVTDGGLKNEGHRGSMRPFLPGEVGEIRPSFVKYSGRRDGRTRHQAPRGSLSSPPEPIRRLALRSDPFRGIKGRSGWRRLRWRGKRGQQRGTWPLDLSAERGSEDQAELYQGEGDAADGDPEADAEDEGAGAGGLEGFAGEAGTDQEEGGDERALAEPGDRVADVG